MRYECPCGYIYDTAKGDPDNGVAPNTKWEDIPEDWVCPTCGLGKDSFYKILFETTGLYPSFLYTKIAKYKNI